MVPDQIWQVSSYREMGKMYLWQEHNKKVGGVPQTRVRRIQKIEETLVPLQDMFL